ncbi:AAA family ATPase [Methylobacterium sp. J-026]|uniref:ATP-binding protein n=1 Tax=Methylobacterium sp. J-026 TaxID=2836624 RepID=UPI001FB885C2|nr:AAA family ATPase [Methylobacterium sp. J-026]MCJ2135621.1 AAA family ATPase [Methylobacterium sp. J-026]
MTGRADPLYAEMARLGRPNYGDDIHADRATVHDLGNYRALEPDEARFAPPEDARPRDAPRKPIEVRWHGDADPNADRAWLVRDLVPETGKGLISGQWGAGKTFGALDLAASVMTLTPFANRRTERQGGVLFIAPEGAFEIPIRLRGLIEGKLKAEAAQEIDLDHLPFAWIEECPRLVEKDAVAHLQAVVQAVTEHLRDSFGLPLAMIVIDTIAAGAGFDDENSASEAQRVMDALQTLSRETGAFVMGVDHFGKSSETGTRGSSAKEAAADVVLAFLGNRDEAGNISNTRLAIRKLRGGRVGMEVPYSLDVVQVGESYSGEPVTTCFVNWQVSRAAAMAEAMRDPWPKKLRMLRSAIETSLIDHGRRVRPFGLEGPEVVAVGEPALRHEFEAAYPAAGETETKRSDAKRKAFKRAVETAQSDSLIGCRDIGGVSHYWLAVPNPDAA